MVIGPERYDKIKRMNIEHRIMKTAASLDQLLPRQRRKNNSGMSKWAVALTDVPSEALGKLYGKRYDGNKNK
jgi:hypothetical protein